MEQGLERVLICILRVEKERKLDTKKEIVSEIFLKMFR